MFMLGFLTDGGVSMIGLISMEVVPTQISGSAHGLACAMAQGQFHLATQWLSFSLAHIFSKTILLSIHGCQLLVLE